MSVKEVMTSLADAVRGRYSVTNKLTVADMTDLINSENIDVAKLIDRSITEITIPEGVTEIGAEAFRGCSQLTSVILPSTIESIGENAFADCPNLTIIDCSFNDDSVSGAPWGAVTSDVVISYNNSPLTFIAAEANSSVSFGIYVGNPTVYGLQYRTDVSSDWSFYPIDHTIQLETVGSYVQFRNTNDVLNSFNQYSGFRMTGRIKATGSVQSLLNGRYDCPDSCFDRLFMNCDSLITAPKLPATTLAGHCYMLMFASCTSLTTAPKLPATKLAHGCYRNMFDHCFQLLKAPELPATNLALYCYTGMFEYCKSLTTAPKLPASDLVDECYSGMFYNCEKLNTIDVNLTSWRDNDSVYSWVKGVAPSGTFYKPSALPEEYGIDRIPEGWTVVNKD